MRLFVAIELPTDLRRLLEEHSDTLSSMIHTRIIRWVRPEGIHLTLKFLGDVSDGKLEAVKAAVRTVGPHFSPFEYSVGNLGCFPNARRPRVIWVGVQEPSGRLKALQAEIEQAYQTLGFEKERRSFHPHLTLGRVRRGVSHAEHQAVADAIINVAPISLGDYRVEEICLYRSELKPTGAVYTKLLVVRLEKPS
ncbi:MAG TPA: RNA 2',3'-cyclic phosphodiesterase [Anaerolineae bacterium]|nr:RNA 2',3'-cyclic phosphodiesterase [Anaerolineae bacterium]